MSDLPAQALAERQALYGDLAGVKPGERENEKEPRISPVTLYVRNLATQMGTTFYTAAEVAAFLGVSVQAVRKYGKNQVCGRGPNGEPIAPSKKAWQGKMLVYLYTEGDVQALRDYLGNRTGVMDA